MDEKDTRRREDKHDFMKMLVEYLRHITALSTGSIVLMASFLEKIFPRPHWKFAVVISFLGFMIAVASSVLVYSVVVFYENPTKHREYTPDWAATMGGLGMFMTWIGFMIGVMTLALFAIRNFIA
jgi:uncharacterized membrane protein